jgi:hypothetical protein
VPGNAGPAGPIWWATPISPPLVLFVGFISLTLARSRGAQAAQHSSGAHTPVRLSELGDAVAGTVNLQIRVEQLHLDWRAVGERDDRATMSSSLASACDPSRIEAGSRSQCCRRQLALSAP